MSLVWNYGRARALANSLRRRAGCFVGDEAAGTMMIFALTIPVVMVAAGGGGGLQFRGVDPKQDASCCRLGGVSLSS
jgi:hypothetical protein